MKARSIVAALTGGLEGWTPVFFDSENTATHALVSTTTARRQLWCAVWAQMSLRADRMDQPQNIPLWKHRFIYARSREIIRMAGFGDCHGLITALGKLGWTAMSQAEAYLHLAAILETDGTKAKTLRHQASLDERTINVIHSLPESVCSNKAVIHIINSKRISIQDIKKLSWRLKRLKIFDPVTAKSWETQMISGSMLNINESDLQIPFPEPPWEGTDIFIPLNTPSKLSEAGRRFSNCLGHHMSVVRMGGSYFYELKNRAIIEFERVGILGWEISYALGPKNTNMDPKAFSLLEHALLTAPDNFSRLIPTQDF